MDQALRNLFLILILMLSAFMLPSLMEAGLLDMGEEDDLSDAESDGEGGAFINNFPTAWIRIPVHQLAALLNLGMSIFTLFVVYLGGRSKHRRFNDRTIDHINLSHSFSLKTALLVGAVFIFLSPHSHLNFSTKYFLPGLVPIFFPNSRRLL